MTALEHNTSTPTTDLDLIDTTPPTSMVVAGTTPQEILQNAARIADSLKDLIEKQGLAVSVGRDRKHVEVGGWQAAGAMLGALGGQPLHAETVWSRRVDRDDAIVYEAHVEVRTLPGETAGAAEAMCSSEERNWRGSDEYAIRSMAETRAESRAYRRAIGWIISLAGFSPTPAEEMGTETTSSSGQNQGPGSLPVWAQPVQDIGGVAESLVRLLKAAGVEHGNAATLAMTIGEKTFDRCDSTVPLAVWQAFNDIADELHEPSTPANTVPVDVEATSDSDTPRDSSAA